MPEIRVKHLVAVLQKMDQEKPLYLDKDGWMENETGLVNPTPEQVIHCRGLLWETDRYVMLNN